MAVLPGSTSRKPWSEETTAKAGVKGGPWGLETLEVLGV